ncbi:hypothetical protein HOLleu_39984 [Holothuria leucospilota]|uniref:Uncharacterized protein n=1 Tax=Holothuria leucospilota TaxID=206669 RepID=A0A9Q1BCP7_HOLLE|nr:hypothetical protein HOLleu_39984 [Holothuria leucospilota]
MPKVFVSPAKKFKLLLRPSPRGQPETQPGDDLDKSERARDLWEKNNELIKGLGRPLDGNTNEILLDDTSEPINEVLTEPSEISVNVSDLANEILKKLQDSMRNIFSLAKTDPIFLRTCFEIIEVQRRNVKKNVCKGDTRKLERLRLKPASRFQGEKPAIFLQEIIQNLENDLYAIKNFVNDYQPNDDYVFRTVAEAYRSHLYNLMEDILQTEVNDSQVNAILIFHGDFRRKFPKKTFTDFWQQDDESNKLHIIPEDKYEQLVERYLQIQSMKITEHLETCRRIEIEFWLSEELPNVKSQNVYVTQWPVDVLDLCQDHLDVSHKIGPEAYYRVLPLLRRELENAITLYAAGTKYYIQPDKHVLPSLRKHPEFEILKRGRGRASQDPPPCFNECVIHAMLNNFSLLHKHLSALSEKYKDETGSEQFVTLQGLVREQAKEWSADSPVTNELCEKINTSISCLDSSYFEDWFELVREKVHLVYLKAISKRCQDIKCKSEEDRRAVVNRFQAERRKIEKTVKAALPCYQNDFIELLDQAAAVVGCTDKDSCSTEVYVIKAKQQKIITEEHLKAILIINGAFKSKRQRKIIGHLFRTDEVQSLIEPVSNPICSGREASSGSDEEAS